MIEKLLFVLRLNEESSLQFLDTRPDRSVEKLIGPFLLQHQIEFMRSLSEIMNGEYNVTVDTKNVLVYDSIKVLVVPTIKNDAFYIGVSIGDSDMLETLLVDNDKAVELVLIIERLLQETIWRT